MVLEENKPGMWVGGMLPVMEYRGSSAWKEVHVAISQGEEYHWLNLMFSILHDLIGSFDISKDN